MASKGGSTRYMKDRFLSHLQMKYDMDSTRNHQGIVVFPRREQHLQNLNKQNQKDNRFPDQVVRG